MVGPLDPGNARGELKEDEREALEEEMVVADMSGLAPGRPILFPVFDVEAQIAAQKEKVAPTASQQPPADISREGQLAAIKGALGASLLIWLVYALGFGLFIFVLTRLFRFL